MFGLSMGMGLVYLLMKSQFSARRNYDVKERFALIMILMGVLCVAIIAIGYMKKRLGLEFTVHQGKLHISRNNISMLLMFAMPFPLYLTKKKDW